MAQLPKEKTIQKNILKFLNGLDQCRARSHTAAGPYNQSGEPDIDGCLAGRSLKLEVKRRPQDQATDLQARTLQEWRKAGAIASVVRSVDDVKNLLAEHGLYREEAR